MILSCVNLFDEPRYAGLIRADDHEQVAAAPGQTLLEKIASLPSNHHPAFMVDPEPTLRTGVVVP